MANEERGIHAMKYRKSTHLAGVDVEAVIAEKGKCIYTIKDAFYARNVDVSGKKADGYFCAFQEEGVKPMALNSTNRKTIIANLKTMGMPLVEAQNIGSWIGVKLDLYFDPSVKMKGEEVGGIRVRLMNPVPQLDTKPAIEKLNAAKKVSELAGIWEKLSEDEKKHPMVVMTKDKLKTSLPA